MTTDARGPARTLPHNLDAERALLGAILVDNSRLETLALPEEAFFRDAHRRIYRCMTQLGAEDTAIDLVTLKDALERAGDLEEVGGPAYLAALTDGVPKSSNLDHYAKIVREKAQLRELIFAANRTLADAYEGDQAPDLIVRQANTRLHEFLVNADKSERPFESIGDQRYRMLVKQAGIVLTADRVRRERNELVGELSVTINGASRARTIPGGIVSVGDMNFSSVQARSTRAKLLKERSETDLDWYGILEEFTTRIFSAERQGKPAVAFVDVPDTEEETAATWELEGFPLLQQLPTVLFGDGGSGKSYFAMFLAGTLAGMGIPVLYADWEFSLGAHRQRVGRLFSPIPKHLHYAKCDRSLKEETERLSRIVRETGAKFLIADSIGFACDGPTESQEVAATYFRALRQIGVGSLSISHIPKKSDESKESTLFGSVYFKNGARAVWLIEKANESPQGQLRFGLHNKKNNVGDRLAPLAFALTFTRGRASFSKINIDDVDEIVASLPLLERLKRLMQSRQEAIGVKELAEELSSTQPVIRSTLNRHKSQFKRIGSKYGLAKRDDELEF